MLDRFNNFMNESKPKIIIVDNQINIVNYKRLISLNDNYISISMNKKKITIKGNNLTLKKILDSELLIEGYLTNIEVIDE